MRMPPQRKGAHGVLSSDTPSPVHIQTISVCMCLATPSGRGTTSYMSLQSTRDRQSSSYLHPLSHWPYPLSLAKLVLGSLVQSHFLFIFDKTGPKLVHLFSNTQKLGPGPSKTGPPWFYAVLCSTKTGLNQLQFRPVANWSQTSLVGGKEDQCIK